MYSKKRVPSMIRIPDNILSSRVALMRKLGIRSTTALNSYIINRLIGKFKNVDLSDLNPAQRVRNNIVISSIDKETFEDIKEKLGVNCTQLYILEIVFLCLEHEVFPPSQAKQH